MSVDNFCENEHAHARYLNDPTSCMICGSQDIVGDSVTIEGRDAIQDMSCSYCGVVWQDVYVLARATCPRF